MEFDEEQLFQHISEAIDREDMKVRKRLVEIQKSDAKQQVSGFLKTHFFKGDSLLTTIILDKSPWDRDAVGLIFYNFWVFLQQQQQQKNSPAF